MERKKNIRKRDKISAMIMVLLIFLGCSSICLYFYFSFTQRVHYSYKEIIVKKAERQNRLVADQNSYQRICDSLYMRIDRFDPGVNASFEESDIKFLITDLKSMYERNSADIRYKVFYHTAQFYDMWFADKKILWSKQMNTLRFRKNLEQCEMGLTRKELELEKNQKRK
ncbi:MAG: type VI secretion system transmembrane protein TssO [Bacteroidales bacterium]